MSTVERLQLDQQAGAALLRLTASLLELLAIRERQLNHADGVAAEAHRDVMKAESTADSLMDRIAYVCAENGLGLHGPPLTQLERIVEQLRVHTVANAEAQALIAELRAELANAKLEHRDDLERIEAGGSL